MLKLPIFAVNEFVQRIFTARGAAYHINVYSHLYLTQKTKLSKRQWKSMNPLALLIFGHCGLWIPFVRLTWTYICRWELTLQQIFININFHFWFWKSTKLVGCGKNQSYGSMGGRRINILSYTRRSSKLSFLFSFCVTFLQLAIKYEI